MSTNPTIKIETPAGAIVSGVDVDELIAALREALPLLAALHLEEKRSNARKGSLPHNCTKEHAHNAAVAALAKAQARTCYQCGRAKGDGLRCASIFHCEVQA